ncbi:hypothetical protein T492DRAFT_879533 [Pavlovales sp. CCMP2436]|nr:hypothetical protein T492DRAFT_879533 [Pavlovales sp. CCMP2436]
MAQPEGRGEEEERPPHQSTSERDALKEASNAISQALNVATGASDSRTAAVEAASMAKLLEDMICALEDDGAAAKAVVVEQWERTCAPVAQASLAEDLAVELEGEFQRAFTLALDWRCYTASSEACKPSLESAYVDATTPTRVDAISLSLGIPERTVRCLLLMTYPEALRVNRLLIGTRLCGSLSGWLGRAHTPAAAGASASDSMIVDLSMAAAVLPLVALKLTLAFNAAGELKAQGQA